MFQGTNAATVRYIHIGCSLLNVCVQVGMCMCVFVLLAVKSDGCGGKGGAITLGLQMGFPQEGHAPVFSETETKANMVAGLSLHQQILLYSENSKFLLPLHVSCPKASC